MNVSSHVREQLCSWCFQVKSEGVQKKKCQPSFFIQRKSFLVFIQSGQQVLLKTGSDSQKERARRLFCTKQLAGKEREQRPRFPLWRRGRRTCHSRFHDSLDTVRKQRRKAKFAASDFEIPTALLSKKRSQTFEQTFQKCVVLEVNWICYTSTNMWFITRSCLETDVQSIPPNKQGRSSAPWALPCSDHVRIIFGLRVWVGVGGRQRQRQVRQQNDGRVSQMGRSAFSRAA